MNQKSFSAWRLLDAIERTRMTGQDMTNYDSWYDRRGVDLLQKLRGYSHVPEMSIFIYKYSDCLADSVLSLLEAQAASTAAEVAIDLIEELYGQVIAKLRSSSGLWNM